MICYDLHMKRPKTHKIGDSASAILPKKLGGSDADFDEQMAVAREVAVRRRSALRELAK